MTPNSYGRTAMIRFATCSRRLTAVLGLLAILLLLMMALPNGRAAADPVYTPRDVLVASNFETVSGAHLGTSVAVMGDVVVLGAPDDDAGKGAVYVYERPSTGWTTSVALSETVKLTAGAIEAGANFGSSVSISGDTIVVGAKGDDGNKGAAYVFVKPGDTWTATAYVARLTEVEGARAAGDFFGEAVSISGDTIVVGAPGGTGAVFVFERPTSGWTTATPNAELSYSDSVLGDDFGGSVATHGDTVVVGAYLDDVGENELFNENQGSAFVYVEPAGGWAPTISPTKHLTVTTGAANDHFGVSVAIREDSKAIVVGAQKATPPAIVPDKISAPNQGAAYVFMRPDGGWQEAAVNAVLSSGATGNASDLYGHSVSISGDTIVVGAYQYGASQVGAAFVYVQPNVFLGVTPADAWASTDTAAAVLTAGANGANGDQFGFAVATSGGTIVAGVPLDSLPNPTPGAAAGPNAVAATEQGSAYLFMNSTCSAQTGLWNSGTTWVGGSPPTVDSDVCISTGHEVTLDGVEDETVLVERLLINPGASLDLATFDIGADLVTNNGTLKQQREQDFIGAADFLSIENVPGNAYTNKGFNLISTDDLGLIAVTLRETIDWFSPTSTYQWCTSAGPGSPAYAQRCFTIAPPAGTPGGATISLWGLADELNGIDPASVAPYHYVENQWEQLTNPVAAAPVTDYVMAEGDTTAFSDFLIGDVSTDMEPLAVALVGMAAGDMLAGTAGLLSGMLLLALVSLILLVRSRRKII